MAPAGATQEIVESNQARSPPTRSLSDSAIREWTAENSLTNTKSLMEFV
jgi:hypothetical protein